MFMQPVRGPSILCSFSFSQVSVVLTRTRGGRWVVMSEKITHHESVVAHTMSGYQNCHPPKHCQALLLKGVPIGAEFFESSDVHVNSVAARPLVQKASHGGLTSAAANITSGPITEPQLRGGGRVAGITAPECPGSWW